MQKTKSEVLRYLENAKEILSRSPIEDNRYTDVIVTAINKL